VPASYCGRTDRNERVLVKTTIPTSGAGRSSYKCVVGSMMFPLSGVDLFSRLMGGEVERSKIPRHSSLLWRNVSRFSQCKFPAQSRGCVCRVGKAAKDVVMLLIRGCAQTSRPEPGIGFRPTCSRLGGLTSVGETCIDPIAVVGA
jgi:hypothetical protein